MASEDKKASSADLDPRLYDCDRLFGGVDFAKGAKQGTWSASLWRAVSAVTVSTVGVSSRIWLKVFNSTRVHGLERLLTAVRGPRGGRGEGDVPLITVANHHSCMDEPLLWGVLSVRELTSQQLMRWALAAHDICFSNRLHANFFALGKSVPIARGDGVYQKGMDFALERLREGHWLHVYPEGKVNADKEMIRYKWGVGRLISECRPQAPLPVVVPIYHLGMDTILPNKRPYIPRFGQRVTVVIGEPILLEETVTRLESRGAGAEEKRRTITAVIQERMEKLRIEAEIWHYKHECE